MLCPEAASPGTSGEVGTGEAGPKACTFCAKPNYATASNCRHCGRFLRGNRIQGVNAAARYKANGTLPPDLRVSIDEFRSELIADQGGTSELTAVRAGLCRLLVDAEAGKRLLMNEVIKKGIDSKQGRQAYDRLLATIDRWTRIAGQLGSERRQRQVDPMERVRLAVIEANRS